MIPFLQKGNSVMRDANPKSLVEEMAKVILLNSHNIFTNLFHIEFDTTVISEIEYLNILPDMELDDSSFLKSSFVVEKANPRLADNQKLLEQNQRENEENLKKIGELERLVAS
jgi:hypothetical protein